jgi:hypothetical protein
MDGWIDGWRPRQLRPETLVLDEPVSKRRSEMAEVGDNDCMQTLMVWLLRI